MVWLPGLKWVRNLRACWPAGKLMLAIQASESCPSARGIGRTLASRFECCAACGTGRAPRPLAHLLGELEPRNGFLIDLCCRLLEEGSGWVIPIVVEVERAQVLETLALVVVVEPEIRGPHVDPDPVGPPLVHRSCPHPMDQRGADALAGAVPADDEP